MTIIGYAYEAALHCPECTLKAQKAGRFAPRLKNIISIGSYLRGELYSNSCGIWIDAVDYEGNNVLPVFDTDEAGDSGDFCDGCHADLRA